MYTQPMECDCGIGGAVKDCSFLVGFRVDGSKQRTKRELATRTLIPGLLKGDERLQKEGDNKVNGRRRMYFITERVYTGTLR